MKKMALIIVTVLMVAVLSFATAQAAFFSCNVLSAGPNSTNNGYTYVQLTDTAATPAFTGRWFIAFPTYTKEILATALTAVSSGMKVQAGFDGTGTPAAYSYVKVMYVTQ